MRSTNSPSLDPAARLAARFIRGLETRPVPVSITGVHGGAGTTTVARLLAATDLGLDWPARHDPQHVFLTARTNAAGLTAASQTLAEYRKAEYPEGPYLAGFILVADAPGRLPKPLRRRIQVLASATMVYRLPWVSQWRLSDTTHDNAIAASLRRFAARTVEAGTTWEGTSCTAA